MITAVDTNILVDHRNENAVFAPASIFALDKAKSAGAIVICDVVYAELCVSFDSRVECDEFLASLGIKVEALDPDSSFRASRNWISYLESGGKKFRILPDFLIAGHAAYQADQLLTRDTGFRKTHFDNLTVVEP
jgi:predicted nucleic acid-binding protein